MKHVVNSRSWIAGQYVWGIKIEHLIIFKKNCIVMPKHLY